MVEPTGTAEERIHDLALSHLVQPGPPHVRTSDCLNRNSQEVPAGTLAEILAHAPPALELMQRDEVAVHFRVRLDGTAIALHGSVPIGPGERVIVEDATSSRDV